MTYRRTLWSHCPLTDFWRVGRGYADKLQKYGLYTMGDIARCSVEKDKLYNEDLLYRMFSNEFLVDSNVDELSEYIAFLKYIWGGN